MNNIRTLQEYKEDVFDKLDEQQKLEWLYEMSIQINRAIEYINKHTRYEHDGDDYGYMEWVDIDETNQEFIENILEILGGSDKE